MGKEKKDKNQEKIEQLELQIKELENARLMALADFDNYKKRVQKEREEISFLGNTMVMNILLDIVDDLKRAISNSDSSKDGLEMIVSKVEGILNEQGIVPVEVKVGDSFDPKAMEAIGTVMVNEELQNNTVVHVDRTGYKYQDKEMMIRTARVIVGKLNTK